MTGPFRSLPLIPIEGSEPVDVGLCVDGVCAIPVSQPAQVQDQPATRPDPVANPTSEGSEK